MEATAANTGGTQAADLLAEFKAHLEADGKSPATVESYIGDVEGFIAYLESKGAAFAGDLSRFHITAYRRYLGDSRYGIANINKNCE